MTICKGKINPLGVCDRCFQPMQTSSIYCNRLIPTAPVIKTPLEELIEKLTTKVNECCDDPDATSWGYVEGIIISKNDGIAILKSIKESLHTEQIAIGFSKWKWDNNWTLFDKESEVLYYINLSKETKTDSELFAIYMDSLKPSQQT